MGGALEGKVALVAGATRGAGRGIAVALGELGAKVWCTGRSVSGESPGGRPETIDQTAAMVEEAGGVGRWARVDHTDPAQVAALCARIEAEDGGLDLLVNDIWGGDALTGWGQPFWEHDLGDGLRLLELAVTTHLITAHHAAPLLLKRPGAVLVEITDGVGDHYRGTLFYDLAKMSTIRLGYAFAQELSGRGVTALTVTPGFLRSEAMLELFGVTEDDWQQAPDPHFAHSETPRYVGRGIAALTTDPERHALAGQTLSSGGLAARYGLRDVDGRQPDFGAYARDLLTDALAAQGERLAASLGSLEALSEAVGELAAPFVGIGGARLLDDLRALPSPAPRETLARAVAAWVRLG